MRRSRVSFGRQVVVRFHILLLILKNGFGSSHTKTSFYHFLFRMMELNVVVGYTINHHRSFF